MNHEAFLYSIQAYVSEHPEVAAHVSDYAARGLSTALSTVRERAALSRRVRLNDGFGGRLNGGRNG